ncbi:MAG TPA: right-handed parallel beta-helix repeat-containing protein, partial [Sedimentisphaerales bacterium]|nr:right-handed parallel beta-helix repeat-containing protein [Sedimentisphaerales bacterium]
ETILEGQIGEGYYEAVKHVVTGDGIEDSIVDGFTIRNSADSSNGAGIYLDNAYVSIVNCKIKNNYDYGIYTENYSYPDIHNCTFIDNVNSGVYSSTSEPDISYCIFDGNSTTVEGLYLTAGSSIDVIDSVFKNHYYDGIYGDNAFLTVDNSAFNDNHYEGLYLQSDVTTFLTNCSIETSGEHGIYAANSDLTMEHCLVDRSADNGLYMVGYSNLTLEKCVIRYSGQDGLELSQNSSTAIKNCWIHNNVTGAGIYFYRPVETPEVRNNTIYGNYTYGIQVSELGADPNILNCIIYANDSNDLYRENEDFEKVNYSSLQNPRSGSGNITGDPGFMNIVTDPNDLHLDETSQCKDTGDPNGSYGSETDIDDEKRIEYGRVDMGADEYYLSNADFDDDGIVNFIDYAVFAAAWQTEPADVNYNDVCDLQDNNNIDFNDLALFCEDWLWEKGWSDGWMMLVGSSGGEGFGRQGMIAETTLGIETVKSGRTAHKDDLMLSSAIESLAARPERLIGKSDKFYRVTAFNTVSALRETERRRNTTDELDVKKLLDWLAEIWVDPEVRQEIDERNWLRFYESIQGYKDVSSNREVETPVAF